MKRISILFGCTVLYSLIPSTALAEPLCMKNARGEEDINICQYAEAKLFEHEIKELEATIRSNLKEIQLERFNTAQTLWLSMTDKDCAFEANFYEGATIYTAIQAQCLQHHYQSRLQTLRNYLCPEHNFTSGCDPSNYVTKNSARLKRDTSATAIPVVEHSTIAPIVTPMAIDHSALPKAKATLDKRKKVIGAKRFR